MTKIIPAIDLIEGKCVRLEKGDYSTQKTYNTNPLEVAKWFEDHGIEHLHLVDLDGAKSGEIINHKVLEEIRKNTKLTIDFGGGIKTEESLKIAFDSGADKVSIGSVAVKNPSLFFTWLQKYGSEKIMLSADAKNQKIAISGWIEDSDQDLIPFLEEYQNKGVKYATITDIGKDGMLCGPNFELYKEIKSFVPKLNIIVSGGVKDIADVQKAIEGNYHGIIIGKAIYENRIDIKDLEKIILGSKS
ncbi:MAG: 1-(5-phosphoribosyl)-5-[(5-phosphoribosylamino)methylideneamino]imidazole-4-carboxamide isomerase [Flavobacteriaceae bacterium]|nr:MAG: 1-(5-phosphoribosyl)-5-[(5-phosphoribosylamino)methylideneamino]imidazole-4-carboxamide isomerase [Flavobacteriaceae bacterium]